MFAFLKRLVKRYGFFHRPVQVYAPTAQWHQHPFFSEEATKGRRLAQIARERDALKLAIHKAMRQKKATSPMYHALQALKAEELALEMGR